jgi:hypothetical protein
MGEFVFPQTMEEYWSEADFDFESNWDEEDMEEIDAPVSLVDIMDNLGLDHGGGAPTSGQTTIPRFVRVWLVRVWP